MGRNGWSIREDSQPMYATPRCGGNPLPIISIDAEFTRRRRLDGCPCSNRGKVEARRSGHRRRWQVAEWRIAQRVQRSGAPVSGCGDYQTKSQAMEFDRRLTKPTNRAALRLATSADDNPFSGRHSFFIRSARRFDTRLPHRRMQRDRRGRVIY